MNNTPGPWHVKKYGGRHEVWSKDKGKTDTFVGVVYRVDDARLIAAAPNIYAALAFIEEKLSNPIPQDPHGQRWAMLDRAREALASVE